MKIIKQYRSIEPFKITDYDGLGKKAFIRKTFICSLSMIPCSGVTVVLHTRHITVAQWFCHRK